MLTSLVSIIFLIVFLGVICKLAWFSIKVLGKLITAVISIAVSIIGLLVIGPIMFILVIPFLILLCILMLIF